jgi:hypothetical protein
MKADLFRYCVIYTWGGLYTDVDTICLHDPIVWTSSTQSELVIAPENNVHLCQWTFAASVESPFLKSVIDMVCSRIENAKGDFSIYGEHFVHVTTGPAVFTQAIEDQLRRYDLPVFCPGDMLKYENYPYERLKVFSKDYFNEKLVEHMFTGNKGWLKLPERKQIVQQWRKREK